MTALSLPVCFVKSEWKVTRIKYAQASFGFFNSFFLIYIYFYQFRLAVTGVLNRKIRLQKSHAKLIYNVSRLSGPTFVI